MAAPSLWVKRDIQLEAARKIKDNNAREAVELLLVNDLSFDDNGLTTENKVDAGALLQTGLSLLASKPHMALGLEVGAGTKEIRCNYKKLAVKYHPDKNPRTTALFQAINTACTKLSDPEQRKVEERNADVKPPTRPGSGKAATNTSSSSSAYASYASSSTNSSNSGDTARRAAEERRQRDDDVKARDERRKTEEEARRRYEQEMKKKQEEELRKQKDDIIKQGQRRYYEDKAREDKEAQIRLERKAAEIEAAARRARSSNVPQADAPGLKSFRGVGARPPQPRAAASATSGDAGKPSVGESHTRPNEVKSNQHSGKTFSVDATGNVRSHSGRPTTERDTNPAAAAPRCPSGLQCISFTETIVDLQWLPLTGLVELNWRNCALSADSWRSANKLISGTKCRKKNLLAGATYEFRIRCVAEKPGGMLGLRSLWSPSILVVLIAVADKEEPSSSAYSYSASDKIRKEVFVRPVQRTSSSGHGFTSSSSTAQPTSRTEEKMPDSSYSYSSTSSSVKTEAIPSVGIPINLRPPNINITPPRRNSVSEVEEEPGLKAAPGSTRGKQAWAHVNDNFSGDASEVDSELDEEDDDDLNTRHVTLHNLVAPPGQRDYEHAVRREPISGSRICGYLDVGVKVHVEAVVGDWVKVKCHRRAVSRAALENKRKASMDDKELWGWCLRTNEGFEYLVQCNATIPEDDDDDDDDVDPININDYGIDGADHYEGVWYEMEDDDGHTYFYNDYSGESSWAPPEWVQETDTQSGASYYMRLNQDADALPLHSTWTRPEQFAKLVRLSGDTKKK